MSDPTTPSSPTPPPEETVATRNERDEKRKKKKKKRSSRGASSFFRNAYRTQLDLTKLADNKASIMISVNGFIVSVSLASGGVLLGSGSRLLLPLLVLLVGCLGSMFYAIVAARPRRAGRRVPSDSDLGSHRTGNLLFHETAGTMSEDEFTDAIDRVLRDESRSNEEMARHLHGLGRVLIRKFRLLRLSYTIFVVGLTASIVTFVAVVAGFAAPDVPTEIVRDAIEGTVEPASADLPRFSHVYEPSGALALGDGLVLLVEDEEDRPFTLASLGPDGRWHDEKPLDPGAELDDLEALARDREGRFYAIGSHARNDAGERRPKREILARFRLVDGAIRELRVLSDLAPHLAAAALDLPEAEAEERMRVLRPGIDVEGLDWDPEADRLLVGFRSPLVDGGAIVVPLGNLDAAFDGSEPVAAGERIVLDLEGDGIRALNPDPAGGYLVVSGPTGSPHRPFRLWHWDGPPTATVRAIELPDPGLPARVEGVTTVSMDDEETLLFVVDDGSAKEGRPASYLLVPRSAIGPD